MKKTLIPLGFLTVLFLLSPVYAIIAYDNTNYGLGIPALDTYIYFTKGRTFTTAYRTGNYWTLDNYRFSVENANATINTLFDSPNMVQATVHGSSGTESCLKIDASNYGYTHNPQKVTYTGQVSNIHYRMEDYTLQLYATHDTTGDLTYEINWAGSSGPGGVSQEDPRYYDPSGGEPEEWQEQPFLVPLPAVDETSYQKYLPLALVATAIVLGAILVYRRVSKKSTREKYRELINIKPKKRRR